VSATDAPEPHFLHVDMDAFFVSVELLDEPELRGRPVVVGGSGDRGVVAAASYEARAFGVFSAMPGVQARRLCPQAVFLPGRYHRYAEVSEQVMAVFSSFTPLVEPLSLDEAFLDVAGAQRLFGPPADIAHQLRSRVRAETGLTCSVGAAPVKFVAKLASEAAKPKASATGPVLGSGVVVVTAEGLQGFLRPLPVKALWGVGPKTLDRLTRLGVATIGELADLPEAVVVSSLGDAHGRHLRSLALGLDDRVVVPDRVAKSVGHEETFAHDHHGHDTLERELVRLADAVGSRLRAQGVEGRTVTLKVRFRDFRTISRSVTLDTPTASATVLARASKDLLAGLDPSPGVRLIGISTSNLVLPGPRQLRFEPDELPPWDDAESTVDDIRRRFGRAAIGPAALLDPDRGLRPVTKGAQQWGPDA
jgi:DNA polymerase-4